MCTATPNPNLLPTPVPTPNPTRSPTSPPTPEVEEIVIPLNSGWSLYGSAFSDAKAFKIGRVVYLKGLLIGPNSDFTIIGVLPQGFRPNGQRIFSVSQDSQVARIDIRENGDIFLVRGKINSWIALDGIQFVID